MNKFIILIILIFLQSCSLDTKSGIWTTKEKIVTEENEKNIKNLFKKKGVLNKELNPNLKIEL